MALSTQNSGALVGMGSQDPGKVYATFLKSTHVKSLGRNSKAGETVEISKADATVLFPYGKARRATAEEVREVLKVEEVLEVAEADGITLTGADVADGDPAEEEEPDPSETGGITLTGADLQSVEEVEEVEEVSKTSGRKRR